MFREMGRFSAEGETGNRYLVISYRDISPAPPRSYRDKFASELVTAYIYRLDDGRELRPAGRDEFELLDTGEVLWKT